MLMIDLNYEDRQTVMQELREKIPKMTRRQLECYMLALLGFTQDESAIILSIKQQVVSEHLGNLWDILGGN